jgi:hypothetical protein
VTPGAFARLGLAMGAIVAMHSMAQATRVWMSEQAIRSEFIGNTLDGHFHDGRTWTVTLSKDGRVEQIQAPHSMILGRWFIRGSVFCSVPNEMHRPLFLVSCWTITKTSTNCYEYFRVTSSGEEPVEDQSRERLWYAKGWRQGEASTCGERPSV